MAWAILNLRGTASAPASRRFWCWVRDCISSATTPSNPWTASAKIRAGSARRCRSWNWRKKSAPIRWRFRGRRGFLRNRSFGKKLQAPTSKLQRNSKHQAQRCRSPIDVWFLELLWSLELGIWSFSAQQSFPQKPTIRRDQRDAGGAWQLPKHRHEEKMHECCGEQDQHSGVEERRQNHRVMQRVNAKAEWDGEIGRASCRER